MQLHQVKAMVVGVALSVFACGSEGAAALPAPGCELESPRAATEPAHARLLWSYERTDEAPLEDVVIDHAARNVLVGGFHGGGTLFPLAGEGEPAWNFSTAQGSFLPAASRDSDILYGVIGDDLGEVVGSAVLRFDVGSAEPIWSYDPVPDGLLLGDGGFPVFENRRPVAVTPDGQVLAVVGAKGDRMAIAFFGASAPEPLGILVTEAPADARFSASLALTPDGRTAFYSTAAPAALARVDIETLAPVASLGQPPGSIVVPSADGELALGLSFGRVDAYRWNGVGYELFWSFRSYAAGFADAQIPVGVSIAADGDHFVVGWEESSWKNVTLLGFSLARGACPLWAYTTPDSSGKYSDVVSSLKVSRDGEWVAVGTWGTAEDDAHPEFMLFRASDPREPFFAIDTVGSVNAVAMSPDASEIVLVGKSTHANTVAAGRTIYAVRLDR